MYPTGSATASVCARTQLPAMACAAPMAASAWRGRFATACTFEPHPSFASQSHKAASSSAAPARSGGVGPGAADKMNTSMNWRSGMICSRHSELLRMMSARVSVRCECAASKLPTSTGTSRVPYCSRNHRKSLQRRRARQRRIAFSITTGRLRVKNGRKSSADGWLRRCNARSRERWMPSRERSMPSSGEAEASVTSGSRWIALVRSLGAHSDASCSSMSVMHS
mmetsp:Transcript_39170/g.91644  ORF Transcript_39170/g.91644 Transcript_39170/m.91644 type:complete len:224 (+) Transcript_39170:618-1289(+)